MLIDVLKKSELLEFALEFFVCKLALFRAMVIKLNCIRI
jgi:hypothetical protein